MQRTKISWATHTWNPAVGCSKVSTGCKNCYAEAMVHRFPWMTGTDTAMTGLDDDDISISTNDGWDGQAHFKPERLEEPLHLRAGKQRPHRIFVCSMSDLFHESLTNEQIASVFGVMAATPQHQYVILTKRLSRAVEWFRIIENQPESEGPSLECAFHLLRQAEPDRDGPIHCKYGPAPDATWPLPNVIMCASVEDQWSADERVPLLLQIPAEHRGVSVEPMLGEVRLKRGLDYNWLNPCQTTFGPIRNSLDLAICGAETGPGKRPFDDDAAQVLQRECRSANVPFFFKKDGAGNGKLCGVEYHEWINE